MRSEAATVAQYLAELPVERRVVVSAVRDLVRTHLPAGYDEAMNWGMITYQVPLLRCPDTYNGQPLAYAAIAAQKHGYSLYLMGIYGDEALRKRFESAYRATGRRFDVGRSCVRFRSMDDLPLEVIADAIAAVTVDAFCAMHDQAASLRATRRSRAATTRRSGSAS